MSNYFCTFVCNYKTIEIFNSIPVISFYNLEVWVKYIIWLFLSCNHLHKSCPGSFTKKTGNYNIYKLIILLKVASALNTITLTYDTIYKQYMGGGHTLIAASYTIFYVHGSLENKSGIIVVMNLTYHYWPI